MRKLLVLIVALSLVSSTSAMQADYVLGQFWTICKQEMIAYSLWFDNCHSGRDIEAAGNMFSCSSIFPDGGPNLGICLRMVQYSYQDVAVQNYFNNCILLEQRISKKNNEIQKCFKENAECFNCWGDKSCGTYLDSSSPNHNDFVDSSKPENCPEIAQECDITALGKFAFKACKSTQEKICSDRWVRNNAQEDKCSANQLCDRYEDYQQITAIN